MKALILAAGYGTRLAAVVKDTPKPLIPIHDRALIDYIVDGLVSIKGLTEVVVVTNNKFYGHFSQWANNRRDIAIRIVNDGTNTPEERLGSVGDIAYAWAKEPALDDWIVVGGDNLYDTPLKDFMDFARTKSPAITIGVYDIKDIAGASKYGVVGLGANNKVTSFTEKPAQPVSSLITMCLYFFPAATLKTIEEYRQSSNALDAAGNYIGWLSKTNDVYGFKFSGKWYDIGSVESLNEARLHFKS